MYFTTSSSLSSRSATVKPAAAASTRNLSLSFIASFQLPGIGGTLGRIVFNKDCSGCHFIKPEKGRKAGPNLWDIAGRDKASYADFAYSDVLLDWEGVWTFEDLNTLLFAPMATTPGTAMEFPGVADEAERANLIAYLRSLSDIPMPLP